MADDPVINSTWTLTYDKPPVLDGDHRLLRVEFDTKSTEQPIDYLIVVEWDDEKNTRTKTEDHNTDGVDRVTITYWDEYGNASKETEDVAPVAGEPDYTTYFDYGCWSNAPP